MDLFDQFTPPGNLLPYDGDVRYYGVVMGHGQTDDFFRRLLEEIPWAHDELVMFGRPVVTRRKVAWYGDRPFTYTYSRATKQALPWVPVLAELKALVEQCSGEPELKKHGAIASVSLGAPRRFVFRHKQSKDQIKLMLEHGSLLVMSGATQAFWQHSLPATKTVQTPRINLTFRTMVV